MMKQFVLQSSFLCITEATNMITDKGFNLFDKSAVKCVHLFPERGRVHLYKMCTKCTHLAA